MNQDLHLSAVRCRLVSLVSCLLICGQTLCAQTLIQPADSIAATESTIGIDSTLLSVSSVLPDTAIVYDQGFNPHDLIAPAALIGTGAIIASTGFGKQFQRYVKKEMAELRGDHYTKIDNYVQYAPAAFYLGLGVCGVKCKHNILERSLAAATAYLAEFALTSSIKHIVREQRPDTSTRNSFPSGHTATAFVGAELCRREYGLGIGIGAYVVASSVGVMRLYNERHWVGDVLAGAGIGILSANIGYWMLPVYQRWFHMKPSSTRGMAALPFYQAETKAGGIAFVALF